jgi:hypothetical protein
MINNVILGVIAGARRHSSGPLDSGLNWSALTRGLNSGTTSVDIQCVATDSLGVWVAGFSTGYAARSTDNGATWSALTQWLSSGATADLNALAGSVTGYWVAGFDASYAARSIPS